MSIDSSIEDVNDVTKKLNVTIPSEMVATEVEVALGNIAKTAKIKGFRPGKAPINMVKNFHGSRVHMEVANRLISSTLGDLVKEHELNMVGSPEIDVANLEEGENISYTANVSLYPSPIIKGYDKFEVEVPKEEVSDTEVDAVIEQLRNSRATSKAVEGREIVNSGDVIEGTLAIALDGEDAAAPEPIVVGLGEGQLPVELEAGIPGIKLGESKQIEGSIPVDHPNQEVRGKKAVFTITVNSISEKILPELNDEFAKGLGIEAETLLELRIKVRERLESEAEKEQKAALQSAVLDKLLERNEFDVPQALIDEEIWNFLVRGGMVDPNKVKMQDIDISRFRDQMGPMAEKRVKAVVMVDQIADQEKIEVTVVDTESHYQEFADQSNVSIEEVKKFFSDEWRQKQIEAEIKRSKATELLVDRAKIKYIDKEAAASTSAKATADKKQVKKSKAKAENKVSKT
ncbi:MAG: trigger factor [Bdellovibrionota bacterium]